MLIIHISGTSGSGKTTLGDRLQKIHKTAKVYDTDGFIQHDTKEGRLLAKIEKVGDRRKYVRTWKDIIRRKIDDIIERYPNKVIIFVELLNNWGLTSTPYILHIPCKKFFLDVPTPEILRRYYLRIYKTEQSVPRKHATWYWKCVAESRCFIAGSHQIIKNCEADRKWHIEHGYKAMSDAKIIAAVGGLIKSLT